MAEHAEQTVLPPDLTARLTDFARTCKAAARAVSLYPPGHPTIVSTVARVAESTGRLTANGPFAIQVHAQELLLEQGRIPKPDASVVELAALLHRHLIGRLTLNAGADAKSWQTLLLLLARSPEEVRADGGIAHLWQTAGGPSIEIVEIDYAEVLREKAGRRASLESIIAAALDGTLSDQDDPAMLALLETVRDADRVRELLEQLQKASAASPQGVEGQTAALLALLKSLVIYLTRTDPQQLNAVFEQFGGAARHFSVEAMTSLLAHRSQPDAMAGSLDVVKEVVERMSDASIAGFVASVVIDQGGASGRLAHAFQALVPEFDRRRKLLGLARDEAANSELGTDSGGFADLWARVEGILISYTDARYVSSDYARELSHARTQPMDVERASDDPPERVAAWVATVNDTALRDLDRDLLLDLLTIEPDPLRWRDVAATVIAHADDLVRVGYFEQAMLLVQRMIDEAAREPARQVHATAALEKFGRGSLMKHLPPFLRRAQNELFEPLKALCHRIGTTVIVPLAEGLAAEQDANARRRLRDILVGFGPRGAESIRPLMNAANWEVRRTAAFLMREFGGTESLKELVPLLQDAEPLVQREAIQGLAMNGSREACAILLNAILSAKKRTRDTLVKEVLAMRDERAAPLFAYILRDIDPARLPQLYDAAIETLSTVRTDDAVDALGAALHQGRWWTPLSNRRRRTAAAQSLRRIGTPKAIDALRQASSRGASGVRSAARTELAKGD